MKSGYYLPLVLLFLVLFAAKPLRAEEKQTVFDRVGFDQRLNRQLPLELSFQDEHGQQVQLRDYFGKRPVILALVYFQCPRLCTLELNGLVRSLRILQFTAGEEFTVLTVSFDPNDTPEMAAEKKAAYLQEYGRAAVNGWHFLTGDQPSIKQLCDSIGFRYFYDHQKQQYAHASGIMVLTPDGKLSRYFFGIEYAPRDVELGLVEASRGEIGSPVHQLLLMCYGYDPATGKYGLLIMNLIRFAGITVVLGLGVFVGVMLYRDRWRARGQFNAEEV